MDRIDGPLCRLWERSSACRGRDQMKNVAIVQCYWHLIHQAIMNECWLPSDSILDVSHVKSEHTFCWSDRIRILKKVISGNTSYHDMSSRPPFYSQNNNQNYFVDDGKTTSRVLQAPGGASSITLSWEGTDSRGKFWKSRSVQNIRSACLIHLLIQSSPFL